MTQPAASGLDQFDPATFTVVEPLRFEDLEVGDILASHGDAGQVTTRATIYNQHGQLVLDGKHTYLLKTAQKSTSEPTS